MRRELAFAARHTPGRPLAALAAFSALEALPAAASGLAVARALDYGFLVGRPWIGLAWLGALVAAAVVGAVGARGVYRRLGDLVEPMRDTLARRVVAGALSDAVHGRSDDGAVARLTRQVEIVRDTHAGLIVLLNNFVITVIGVVAGLSTIDPIIPALFGPPFFLGMLAFAGTLGLSAARQRAAIYAEEDVAAVTGQVLAGTRDVVACGSEEFAAELAGGMIDTQAAAQRSLARVAALRSLSFALGGWLPLVVLLFAGPWLLATGMSTGQLLGGMTYVLFGLQPALRNVHAGMGGAGLRFVVTLGRILDAGPGETDRPVTGAAASGTHELAVRGLSFAYGRHAEPVLRELSLVVPQGEHLAIVGPSGVGKSTLAALLCGLLPPDQGVVTLGGVDVGTLDPAVLARQRVLIPQQSYVFSGTVWENVTYLRAAATPAQVRAAVEAVGARELVDRLGGCAAQINPDALSAGERQLLALARAYLSPAPLVVLDEATCHLDPAAERRAERAFSWRPGTLIVIAHRLSSARRAGRVLVLDGDSTAVGDHESLLATSPLYRNLLTAWTPTQHPQQTGIPEQPAPQPAGR